MGTWIRRLTCFLCTFLKSSFRAPARNRACLTSGLVFWTSGPTIQVSRGCRVVRRKVMPQRPFSRDQVFLIPPSLDDWLAADHPARFVAVWLDELTGAEWSALGIDREPARTGEKRYAPEALLAIWVYGFMVGIRSSRALEAACRDQVPFRWLSGNQQPDHNTLARFYQRHRRQLRHLFQRSVQTAVHAGLVDFALQAVDGTKIAANAAGD